MGIRLRLLIIALGAALVAATFAYPLWRPEPDINFEEAGFPGLEETLQDAFLELPARTQRIYLQMNEQNPMRTIELLTAHLSPGEPLPEEEAAMPPIENAVLAAEGEFAPVVLDPEDERTPPPFSELYAGTTGEVLIYQYPDNTRFLRIEDLEMINGPDLHVALSPNATPLTADIAEMGNIYIDIGPLKTNSGNQNYFSVPDANNINLNNYASVVIYDQTHRIVYGVARIR